MIRHKRRMSATRNWTRVGKRLVRLQNLVSQDGSYRNSNSFSPTNKRISLLDLPDECILMILEKLEIEPHEICQLMKVCKKFYEISFSSRLWRIADFRFSSYLHKFHRRRPLSVDSSETHLPDSQRRKMFALFLQKRKARLSHLRINCDIYTEMDYLGEFLDKCYLRDLKYVEFKWTVYWNLLLLERKNILRGYFIEVLQKLSSCCPDIYFLKCQLEGSCATARIIGSMKNIQHLNLNFAGELEKEGLSPISISPVEVILNSLPKLKYFKLTVTQHLDEEFEGYTLKSDSLEYLEYSWSKGFRIKDIDLPNLHSFMAINVYEYYQGRSCPCLFDLIREGCPDITRLNFRRSIISGLENFPLTEDDEQQLYICQCDIHGFWRGQE